MKINEKMNNMKSWLLYIENNREELETKLTEAFKLSMFDNSKFSGCYTGVEMDSDSIWVINPTSQNSFSQSSWNGTSTVLHTFDCYDCTDSVDMIQECISTNDYSDNKIIIPDNFDELEYNEKVDIFKYGNYNIWSEAVEGIKEYTTSELDTDEIINDAIENIKDEIDELE